MSSSDNIRSVIKARGLQQRSNVVGRTFAVFRMDATKHLLSLISKIIPSPDWIVGVSMENLCLANGSWVDSRVVDLYPWDAGTNSGLGYHDHGNKTIPREAIHRITSCNPDNNASPFYDPTCAPVKPVARLHILKQREYKKQCPGGMLDPASLLNPAWGAPNGAGRDSISDVYGTGVGPNLGGDHQEPSYDDYDGNYGDSPRQTSSRPRSSYSSSRSRDSSGKTCFSTGTPGHRSDCTLSMRSILSRCRETSPLTLRTSTSSLDENLSVLDCRHSCRRSRHSWALGDLLQGSAQLQCRKRQRLNLCQLHWELPRQGSTRRRGQAFHRGTASCIPFV